MLKNNTYVCLNNVTHVHQSIGSSSILHKVLTFYDDKLQKSFKNYLSKKWFPMGCICHQTIPTKFAK
jgi:hypothetical protein